MLSLDIHAPATLLRRRVVGKTILNWKANNWSGYARSSKSGAYTSVTGYWTVPAVSPSKINTYSSTWIGIDGFQMNNINLIQTGTASSFVNGSAEYHAWWEILPAAETVIPHKVQPGDRMKAHIQKLASGKWRITLQNLTKGWKFSTVRKYKGSQSSVEFIQEAPTVNGKVAPLAHYKKVIFDKCLINGKNPKFKASERGTMIQNGIQVSTPSFPNSNKDGFAVAYGSKIPKPPATYAKRLQIMKIRKRNTCNLKT